MWQRIFPCLTPEKVCVSSCLWCLLEAGMCVTLLWIHKHWFDCVVAHCYGIQHTGSRFTSEVILSSTVAKLSAFCCLLFTPERCPLTNMKAWWSACTDYITRDTWVFPNHFPLIEEAHSLLFNWELVSGGIFNQSGSVFYRISPENSLLEIQLGKLPTWLPVCYERWNSSLGTLVCRQLGYLRLAPLTGSHHTTSASWLIETKSPTH